MAWALSLGSTYGQATDSLASLRKRFDAYSQQTLQEKLYVHTDRPFYVSGEILWFKLNAVDGTQHKPLAMSKVAYVELLDKEHNPVLQAKINLQHAAGNGSWQLPASLVSGNYVLRAYTNWMKNFSPDFYSSIPVTIINTRRNLAQKASKDSAAVDVQFFPEGGNLVKGIESKVAFKITNSAGKGVAAEGTVRNPQGAVVSQFKTLKFGIGNFTFTPAQEGVAYTASIKLPGGQVVTRKLPAAHEYGYTLHLEDISPGQLRLTVASNIAEKSAEDVFLVGHSGQQISVSTATRLAGGRGEFVVEKKNLADGISHFTIFNSRKQPLSERLYFQRPKPQLLIAATADKPQYGIREKVVLQLSTTSSTEKATPADMSLAVYRLDSLTTVPGLDVNSYLWLTSDLKGTVENPNYYFTSTGPEIVEVSDNLMLTHGWSRFLWTDVFSNKAPHFEFAPEINGHVVEGRVVNGHTGAPAPKVGAYLASPSRLIRMYNATSDQNGRVRFETRDFFGSKELVLQTNTQRDSLYRVEIINPFSVKYTASAVPPLVFSESFRTELGKRSLQMQVQNAYFRKQLTMHRLPAADSTAFYGKPDETYKLDDYTRFKVLEEVMREYVPGVQVRLRNDGFHFMVLDNIRHVILNENPMVLLDGVPVFDINKIMAMDPLKIQKLDVITSRYFQGSMIYDGLVSYTTYKGDLAGFELNPHALVQEYEGMQWQREFYAPRYETAAEKQSRLPDARTLLYWNPNVATSADGKKSLEFYTSDHAGKYLVVIQGLAENGLVGSRRFTFEVKQPL
ncbi:hypothetical protein [Hymenobacter sp. BT491]|uniref:hypothetical protein n=1 Tax=Hymenobacter sp. BT491 TaxID=2766779 RepID=UPI001653AB0A|nr:hypothetical protein [Hymenobacter sp. BT491]MBC6988092.1 hypothetical protein [Hymenobacter sp. BT491]